MYSPNQLRIIAYEFARAGGNVRKSVRALREEYETFDKFSTSTLRRAREQKDFLELYEQFVERIRAAKLEAEQEVLDRQVRTDMESSRTKDIAVLDVLQQRGKKIVPQLKPDQVAKYHVNLLRVIERRRQHGPGAKDPGAARKSRPSSESPSIENT